ncbi:MAG: zinc-binding dehydrogenase [Gemmatimonadota bacterium]
MRALCLTATGGSQNLALLELPEPRLGAPDEVRIAIRAVALNRLDLWVAAGLPAVPLPAIPHIVGCDGAGVVLEVGSAVRHLAVGDRVVLNPGWGCGECTACRAGDDVFCREFGVQGEHRSGTAAEQVVVPARAASPIRGEWSWAEAAAFPLASLTAWRMLTTRARLQRDETVLIWGIGGGVALATLQIARHLGARVAVTSGSAEKRARALAMGAELALDHGPEGDVVSAVKQHFGQGVDVVMDSVGEATWDRSLRAMRPGGRLVTCGSTSGHDVGVDLRRLFWFQWSLLGSTMGTPREFAEVLALGEAGLLRPPVDAVLPLADGKEAYRRLAAAEQFGKLVLEVSP